MAIFQNELFCDGNSSQKWFYPTLFDEILLIVFIAEKLITLFTAPWIQRKNIKRQTVTSLNNPLRSFKMRKNLSFEKSFRFSSNIECLPFKWGADAVLRLLLLRQEPWICSCQKHSKLNLNKTFYRSCIWHQPVHVLLC